MTGTGSSRSLSKFTQEYYSKHIEKEYGKEQFKKSLQSFYKLIEKFEGKKIGVKKSMPVIYDTYFKLV